MESRAMAVREENRIMTIQVTLLKMLLLPLIGEQLLAVTVVMGLQFLTEFGIVSPMLRQR